jgi:uncharacterized protein YdhG (YjbR/CyaY superfamily)
MVSKKDDIVPSEAFQQFVEGIAPEFRPLFDRVDRLTRTLHPEATVGISYAMPTYRVGKGRLNVGVWKHGLSIYGWMKDRPSAFLSNHPKLVTSTGTIRLTPADAATISDAEIGEIITSSLGS